MLPLLLASACAAAADLPQQTIRISTTSTGVEIPGASYLEDMTPDGRFVCFSSPVDGIVPPDQDGEYDYFVVDTLTGNLDWVSVTAWSGNPAGSFLGGPHASMSADGRYVAFASRKDGLVGNDSNQEYDVFVRDRLLGVTERISVGPGGLEADGASWKPEISADGRWVTYFSVATNLLPGSPGQSIYLCDRETGRTRFVHVNLAGEPTPALTAPDAISADGRYVCFFSSASDLVPGDLNEVTDVFLRDVIREETILASGSWDGRIHYYHSSRLASDVSADGRTVSFMSQDRHLIPGGANGARQIYFRDLRAGTIAMASVNSSGLQSASHAYLSALSANGRFVGYPAHDTNLTAGGSTWSIEYYLHDRVAGTTELVSQPPPTGWVNGSAHPCAVSADGRYVAFDSRRADLVAGDTNMTHDVFVRDRGAGSGSGTGTVLLTMDHVLRPREAATFRWSCAPPGERFQLVVSLSDAGGYFVAGHPVDLQPPIRHAASGWTGPEGRGGALTARVPSLPLGTELFFEMIVMDSTATVHDSNVVARPIL